MKKNSEFREQQAGFVHLTHREHGLSKKDRLLDDESAELLTQRLRQASPAAASEFVDIYYKQIYLYMRRLGHDHQIAEDLTQESFLRAWQHLAQLRSGKSLKTWIYMIAANVSRQHWRRNKKCCFDGIDDIELSACAADNGCDTGDFEQLNRLKNEIAQLPMKFKQTVVLHYMQQLTIAEAARALGIREGTFKSRLSRALKTLRKRMAGKSGKSK